MAPSAFVSLCTDLHIPVALLPPEVHRMATLGKGVSDILQTHLIHHHLLHTISTKNIRACSFLEFSVGICWHVDLRNLLETLILKKLLVSGICHWSLSMILQQIVVHSRCYFWTDGVWFCCWSCWFSTCTYYKGPSSLADPCLYLPDFLSVVRNVRSLSPWPQGRWSNLSAQYIILQSDQWWVNV